MIDSRRVCLFVFVCFVCVSSVPLSPVPCRLCCPQPAHSCRPFTHVLLFVCRFNSSPKHVQSLSKWIRQRVQKFSSLPALTGSLGRFASSMHANPPKLPQTAKPGSSVFAPLLPLRVSFPVASAEACAVFVLLFLSPCFCSTHASPLFPLWWCCGGAWQCLAHVQVLLPQQLRLHGPTQALPLITNRDHNNSSSSLRVVPNALSSSSVSHCTLTWIWVLPLDWGKHQHAAAAKQVGVGSCRNTCSKMMLECGFQLMHRTNRHAPCANAVFLLGLLFITTLVTARQQVVKKKGIKLEQDSKRQFVGKGKHTRTQGTTKTKRTSVLLRHKFISSCCLIKCQQTHTMQVL